MALKIKKSVKESKQPRIVEYTSPEKQEILNKVRQIDNKWYKDVTDEDKEWLKQQGLEWKNGTIYRNGVSLDIPHSHSWDPKERDRVSKIDFIDVIDKQAERGTVSKYSGGKPHMGSGQKFRTSPDLEKASKELNDAKKWGTQRQQKVWQGKYNRENDRLSKLRQDSENKAWRAEQNKEMQEPYNQLRYINKRLNDTNPDDDYNGSYDAEIRRAERDKTKREQELLQRYQDELARYQQRIDDAKAQKQHAVDRKAQILRRPAIEVKEDEVEEVEESCKVNEDADVTDQVIIKVREPGFIDKKHELQDKGYKVIGSGEGVLIMAKPKPIGKKESCKVNESPVYDLLPEYDNRKSFYNKARVDVNGRTGDEKLYSYNTLVAEIKDGKPVVYGTYSATTLRHIKEWLKQNGFKADTAKQIMADYGEKFDESAKVCPECGKRKCVCNPDDK